MPTRYIVTPNLTQARSRADELWTAYEARERAARGLAPGESLDVRAGRRLPNARAVTVRYAVPLPTRGGTRALVPVDAADTGLTPAAAAAVPEEALSPDDRPERPDPTASAARILAR